MSASIVRTRLTPAGGSGFSLASGGIKVRSTVIDFPASQSCVALDAEKAFAFLVDDSQDVSGQSAVRVVAGGSRHQVQAGHVWRQRIGQEVS
jgi:hypothetical protein